MESKKYNVLIAPSVDSRLAEHVEFLARVSESAALRLYEEYENALGFLEDVPKSCSIYTPKVPIDAELRYKLFFERYRIVFEIINRDVYVYDIQDCRQDTDKSLL